jgi:hypothetical protein
MLVLRYGPGMNVASIIVIADAPSTDASSPILKVTAEIFWVTVSR